MPRLDWLPENAIEAAFDGNSIEPATVLYDLDGPRIFVTRDNAWEHLWYLCDEDAEALRYLSVPTSPEIIEKLTTGLITVYEALSAPGAYLVDLCDSFRIRRMWRVSLSAVPERYLPKKHVMLYAHLEPLLSVKLTGHALQPGRVPASAVKRGVDGAYLALKKLAEAVVDIPAIGRPARSAKRLFDLPTQRLAFGSIEIAFASHQLAQPELIEDEDAHASMERMGQLLGDGLKWASGPGVNDGARPQLAVLEALEKLCPPLDGAIEQVSVRGGLLPSRREYSLGRNSSRKIRFAIREAKREEDEEVILLSGYVREFDRDKQTFILRSQEGEDLGNFVCDEGAYEEAFYAFSEETQVQVLGRRLRGRPYFEAGVVAQVPENVGDAPQENLDLP